jgi:tetratricopeptide (TPR) repeat protein
MRGRIDEAREYCSRAAAIFEELGLRLPLAGLSQVAGAVELLARAAPAAEEWLRRGLEILGPAASTGRGGRLQAALLAESLYAQERFDEAEALARSADRAAVDEDVHTEVLWRSISGRLAARRDERDLAERYAREAVELAAGTDALNLHGDALASLAYVLHLHGKAEEALAARDEAEDRYRRKGNVAALEALRDDTG